MTEAELRNATNKELANRVLLGCGSWTRMELALANRLLDATEDLEEAEKAPRCECE